MKLNVGVFCCHPQVMGGGRGQTIQGFFLAHGEIQDEAGNDAWPHARLQCKSDTHFTAAITRAKY